MDHTLALIGRAHQGDKAARDTLVEENAGLVYSVAKRFVGRGVDMEDLIQIGSIGLIKAVDKFDLSFDVRFSTYAVPIEYDKGNDRKSLKIRALKNFHFFLSGSFSFIFFQFFFRKSTKKLWLTP